MARFSIEIAKHERMAPSGSALLKSLQNDSLPVLDLLVREAFQNSLDAALPDVNHVNIDISVGSFVSPLFSSYFEGIHERLNAKYGKEACKYLAIRDTNTVGLTGKLHYSENNGQDFGNLQKLIYEISKPQTSEGAGGSWGLGKTVYFRAGIGLVLYYSRIKDENGQFASRMAATLVEDEGSDDALIQYPDPSEIKRGIAWWGESYPAVPGTTCPVTDQSSIQNMLDILGITPYGGEQTGTMVIIPYIDEKKLLSGIAPADDIAVGTQGSYYWLNSVEAYLKLAVQKWYTPRLSTKYKYGPYLKASINQSAINADMLAPIYKVFLNLYEMTAQMTNTLPKCETIDGVEYECKALATRNILEKGGTIGHVAYAKVSESILHMNAPDNDPNPYAFVGRYDVDRTANPPLLAYTRKPGMIVNYVTAGNWLDGVPASVGEEFIVAVFVLNSENTIIGFPGKKLEEYVRKSEKSDHTSWSDWAFSDKQSYIISRIKSSTSKTLRDHFKPNGSGPTTLTHSGLEKALADLLLPPDGFGKKPGGINPPPPHPPVSGKVGINPKMTITATTYTRDQVEIAFDLITGKKAKELLIELQVQTDSGALHADGWEDPGTIGKRFPLCLQRISLNSGNGESVDLDVDDVDRLYQITDDMTAQAVVTSRNRQPYAVRIVKTADPSATISGKMAFTRSATDVIGVVSLTAKEGK